MAKVTISRNAEDLLDLAKKVFNQHQKLGPASPLNMLDWPKIGPKIQIALDEHNKAEELKKLSELAYEQRDILLSDIDTLTKQSRDVLKGVYRNEPKKLGEFGFDVTDSPKVSKVKSSGAVV